LKEGGKEKDAWILRWRKSRKGFEREGKEMSV
jgi:hypothetical protein